MCMLANAEVIRLDLEHPTNPEAFTFNENGMWTETWNEDATYTFFESQAYAFSHLLGGNSWGGTYWTGFTVSKATKDGDGTGYYSNVAKGGIRGKGSPYMLAYYDEWWLMDDNNDDMMSSNQILFGGEAYYPRYVYLNNAFASYDNILHGGGAARAFAQGDKFEVWIQGITEDLDETTDEKVVYRLADYTSDNEDEWFVNTEWAKVDLSALGQVYGLAFTVVSTDQGMYGTNTATYFALDGLTVTTTADEIIPEPVKVATFENEEGGINLTTEESNWFGADEHDAEVQWYNWKSGDFMFQTYATPGYKSAWVVTNETSTTFSDYNDAYRSASGGAFEGDNYAVWNLNYYGADTLTFDAQVVDGFFINNNTYAVSSMCNGDGFAKKFGEDDWFKLTITGLKNKTAVGTVDFYLANDGKYVNEWTYVDLSELGEIEAITFGLTSTDNGDYGMNTPTYFCMDNFGAAKPAGYEAPEMAEFPADATAINNTNAAVKATKMIRNGQVIIIRDGKAFNILGAEL